jgi:hypothetical protein
MTKTQILTAADFLTETQVVNKAAEVHGLIIERKHGSCWETADIGEYPLNTDFLSVLEKIHFTFERDKERPNNGMKYLSGRSHQTGEIFESDCWAFKTTEENPHITVSFHLVIGEHERGVIAMPSIWGNCEGGACHRPTIDKLAIAVASHFDSTHALLKRMTNRSHPVIQWREMGLGGLRSISTLFDERFGRNKMVCSLSMWHNSPFSPGPSVPMGQESYFVPEHLQSSLIRQWVEQLEEFKDSLR